MVTDLRHVPVLVVDDDVEVRATLQLALEDEGYQVVLAADGADCLQRMRASPRPMVVLLDWRMPGMDGMQVLEEIAADAGLAGRHVVVLMTAAARVPERYWQVRSGESAALTLIKPFDLDELLALVARAAGRLA